MASSAASPMQLLHALLVVSFLAFSFLTSQLYWDSYRQENTTPTNLSRERVKQNFKRTTESTHNLKYATAQKDSQLVGSHNSLVKQSKPQEVSSENLIDTSEIFTQIPAFTKDESELVLNAIIELAPIQRSKSIDVKDTRHIYVTSILLSHYQARVSEIKKLRFFNTSDSRQSPKSNIFSERKEANDQKWVRFIEEGQRTKYSRSGQRRIDKSNKKILSCSISISIGSNKESYLLPGNFIPNRMTQDPHSNKKLDIFRCGPIPSFDTVRNSSLIRDLLQKDSFLSVSLIKDDIPIIKFKISWRSRSSGFLLGFNPNSFESYWPSHLKDVSEGTVARSDLPKVDVAVPYTGRIFSRVNAALILEFIAHHILVGAGRIYLSTPSTFESEHYHRLSQALEPWIATDRVVVIPQTECSEDGFDVPFLMHGIVWSKGFIQTLQSTSVLLFSRGISDYLLLLDLDTFFVPTLDQGKDSLGAIAHDQAHSLLLEHMDETLQWQLEQETWYGGPGWADGHRHPLCYLYFPVQSVRVNKKSRIQASDWIGRQFVHASEIENNTMFRIMLPVDSIYYTGPYAPGACAMDWRWSGCSQDSSSEFCLMNSGRLSETVHYFDEAVAKNDGRLVAQYRSVFSSTDPAASADVYHFRQFDRSRGASYAALEKPNSYSALWFPKVHDLLSHHGLALIVDLPERGSDSLAADVKSRIQIIDSSTVSRLKEPKDDDDRGFENKIDATAVLPALREELDSLAELHFIDPDKNDGLKELSNLPAFTVDNSELVLSAILERALESWDLHITISLLAHGFVRHKQQYSPIKAVHPRAVSKWEIALGLFEGTRYLPNGLRDLAEQEKYHCRIRNMVSDDTTSEPKQAEMPYEVPALFIPSASEDESEVDILRCSMGNSHFSYGKYADHSKLSVSVELIREGRPLIRFRIPWTERMTGFGSIHQQDLTTHLGIAHNDFFWKGRKENGKSMQKRLDKLHVCILPSSLEDALPSHHSVAKALLSIQHFLSVGAGHVYLGMPFLPGSLHMHQIEQALHLFLVNGSISISPLLTDPSDDDFASAGAVLSISLVRSIFANSCLYRAKGVAEYVAMVSLGTFLQISGGRSIGALLPPVAVSIGNDDTVMKDMKTSLQKTNSSKPFCFVSIQNLEDKRNERIGGSGPLIVLPTSRIFYAGVDKMRNAACSLPYPYNGCEVSDSEEACITRHSELESAGVRRFDEGLHDTEDGLSLPAAEVSAFQLSLDSSWHLSSHAAHSKAALLSTLKDLDRNALAIPVISAFYERIPDDTFLRTAIDSLLESLPLRLDSVAYDDFEDNLFPLALKNRDWIAVAAQLSEDSDRRMSGATIFLLPLSTVAHRNITLDYAHSGSHSILSALLKKVLLLQQEQEQAPDASVIAHSMSWIKALQCHLTSRGKSWTLPVRSIDMDDRTGYAIIQFTIPESERVPSSSDLFVGVDLIDDGGHALADTVSLSHATGSGWLVTGEISSNSHALSLERTSSSSSSSTSKDMMYLCVVRPFQFGNSNSTHFTSSFSLLLEFLQHHINLGVEHVYLPVLVSASVGHMEISFLLVILRTFIESGKLTIWPIRDGPIGLLIEELLPQRCRFAAATHGAAFLGVWGHNQMLIPSTTAKHSHSLTKIEDVGVEASHIPSFRLDTEEAMNNILFAGPQHQKRWIVDIYKSDAEKDTQTSNAGQVLSLQRDASPSMPMTRRNCPKFVLLTAFSASNHRERVYHSSENATLADCPVARQDALPLDSYRDIYFPSVHSSLPDSLSVLVDLPTETVHASDASEHSAYISYPLVYKTRIRSE